MHASTSGRVAASFSSNCSAFDVSAKYSLLVRTRSLGSSTSLDVTAGPFAPGCVKRSPQRSARAERQRFAVGNGARRAVEQFAIQHRADRARDRHGVRRPREELAHAAAFVVFAM